MCRNIKTLFNFDPPVTAEEARAAALQFVRKISGFNKPSKPNEARVSCSRRGHHRNCRAPASYARNELPSSRNREQEAAKAKLRAAERFGT